jgi:hypothetical protein
MELENHDYGDSSVNLYQTDDCKTAKSLAEMLVRGTPIDGGYPDKAYVVDTHNSSDDVGNGEKKLQELLEWDREYGPDTD